MIGNINMIKVSRRTWILLVFLAISTIIAGPAHAALGCSACHTMPPQDSAAGDRLPASGAFKGNHQGHSSNSVASCVPCHGAAVSSYSADHSAPPPGSGSKPVIRLTPALNNYSISHALATYSRGTFFNQTSVPPSPLGTCSNVNCHFESTTPAWGTANFTSPNDCDKCHGAPPSAIDPGSHAKHAASYPGVTNCRKCHPNNTTFQHATSAGNRPLNVNFAAAPNNGSGSYTGPLNDYLPSQNNVFGVCNATYCHGTTMSVAGDRNGGTNITPTWGTASTGQCGTCHGADVTNPPHRGSHQSHTGNAQWYFGPFPNYINSRSMACTVCHKNYSPKHVDGNADWSFDSTSKPWLSGALYKGISSGSATPVPSAYGTCTNLYCHSIVQTSTGNALTGLAGEFKTPTWGNVNEGKCGTCHFVDAAHNFNAGETGKPEMASGSHTKHLKYLSNIIGGTGPARCAVCHNYAGTDDALTGCGTTPCHSVQPSAHVDNRVDVKFPATLYGATAAYTGTPAPGDGFGGCSNVSCHGNGLASSPSYYTPTWGNVASGACGTCHGVTAAAPPASTPHIDHVGNAKPYLFACDVCHNGKVQVTANSTVQPAYANLTSHVNKVREVKFNSGSPFGTYSSVTQSCRNLYCHSTGNLNVTAGALPAAYNGKLYTRQTWSGSLACNGCHGRSSSNGMPDYTNGGVATTTANSHAKHVTSSSIACVQCHEKTTKTGTTIRNTIPSKHVDATTHDVFFNLSSYNIGGTYNSTRQRCYNTYCHSNGSKASGPFVPYSSTAWGGTLDCKGCHKSSFDGTSNISSGSHSAHIFTWGGMGATLNCVKCHAATTTASMTITDASRHANSRVDIAFNNTSSAANGFYNTSSAKPATPYGKSPGSAYNTCTNVYCHSTGQGNNGSWPPTYKTPTWGSATTGNCGTCHGINVRHGGTSFSIGSSTTLATGSHAKHLTFGMGFNASGIKCAACHSYKIDGAFSPTSCSFSGVCHTSSLVQQKHPNYEVNVGIHNYFGATAAYNGTTKPGDGYGNCANTYCHSDGKATPTTYTTPTWGNVASGACGTCHGVTAAAPPASTAHAKHVGSAYPYIIACASCHSGKVQVTANSTIQPSYTNLTSHVNKVREVKFDAMNPGATYTSGTQTCNTSYCHSLGNLNVTNVPPLPAAYSGSIYAAPTWTGSLGCNGCHGRSTEDGEPDYTNGGPGAITANSHSKHLSFGDISCSECHRRTTVNGTTIRTDFFPSSHVNTITNDIFFNLSGTLSNNGTYTKATKTCTTVACHSNGRGTYKSAQWGVTDNCDYCHPIADLGGAHAKHVDLSQTVSFYTYTANRSTSSGHNFGCSNCHPLSTENSHPIVPIMLDFRPAVAGVGKLRSKNSAAITAYGPVGTANGGTTADSVTNSVVKCLNVYCHSNGYALNTVFATTPNWYGGAFSGDKCANCHGNSPNSTIVGSAAHYSTNFMGQGVTDGHLVGIHYDTIFTGTGGLAPIGTSNVSGHGNATTATTMGCNLCHYATVTITNNDKNVVCASCHNGTQAALRSESTINNKSNHVNGVADVSFNPIKVRSKAQMLNAAVITPYSSVWTRNNGYKNAGSYDEAKAALDTATMWDSATKTCSNVSCHNNQPVKWGSTNGTTSCQRCHPNM